MSKVGEQDLTYVPRAWCVSCNLGGSVHLSHNYVIGAKLPVLLPQVASSKQKSVK